MGKGKPRGGKRQRTQSRKSKASAVGARGKVAGVRTGGIPEPGHIRPCRPGGAFGLPFELDNWLLKNSETPVSGMNLIF